MTLRDICLLLYSGNSLLIASSPQYHLLAVVGIEAGMTSLWSAYLLIICLIFLDNIKSRNISAPTFNMPIVHLFLCTNFLIPMIQVSPYTLSMLLHFQQSMLISQIKTCIFYQIFYLVIFSFISTSYRIYIRP